MSQVDSAKLVYSVLVNDGALAAAMTNQVGEETVVDIYGPPGLPVEWTIRQGFFFLGGGGPDEDKGVVERETFDFYCYGRDAAEARQTYLALLTCLKRKKHARLVIDGETHIFQYSQKLSGPQDRTDPTEGWDLVFCSFMIHFIETTVP